MTLVHPADNDDREAVSAMLARAFRDDPAFAYIFPDPEDRAVRLPRLFRLLFDSDGRAGMRLATECGAAAALWRAPGRVRTGWGEMLAQALPLASALGGNAGRALRVAGAMDAHMPAGRHWYLHYAGCAPDRQRQGLGGATVRAGLERVGGTPVYLETAVAANLGFYEQLGFAVTAEWRVGAGGPCFWSMLRKAPEPSCPRGVSPPQRSGGAAC